MEEKLIGSKLSIMGTLLLNCYLSFGLSAWSGAASGNINVVYSGISWVTIPNLEWI